MPCINTGYDWCRHLHTAYRDGDKEYCIFHAPQGRKGLSTEQFNEQVFKRIASTPQGEECNLSGTVFDEYISFNGKELPPIDFRGARFDGNAYFGKTHFNGLTSFEDVQFIGWAHFRNAKFDAADFIGVHFSREVDFQDAQFSGVAAFERTQFRDWASFNGALFGGEADFNNTIFIGEASFFSAQFAGKADFGRSRFSEETNFFDARFIGNADFGYSSFKKKTSFVRTKWDQASFANVEVGENVRFESVDLRKVSFRDTDMKKMDFVYCTWPKIHGSNCLYDEALIFHEKGTPLSSLDKIKNVKIYLRFYPTISQEFEKMEMLYRGLKQKYKEEHNEAEASIWHYREKEMWRKRSRLRRLNPISLSNLYWLSSGYGERVFRAGVMLVALFMGLALLSQVIGLKPEESKIFAAHPKNFLAVLLNTAEYATFSKTPLLFPINLAGECLKLLTRILVPIQTALLFLAIRNRFRR